MVAMCDVNVLTYSVAVRNQRGRAGGSGKKGGMEGCKRVCLSPRISFKNCILPLTGFPHVSVEPKTGDPTEETLGETMISQTPQTFQILS